jgi:ribonuclease HI
VHLNAWLAYCDGSAMPNPGRMGLGGVIAAQDGTVHTLSQAPQGVGCNNEAELRALHITLQELKRLGAKSVLIHCDNSIVVEQIGHANAKPIARLAALFDETRALFNTFDHATLVWIPRHRNSEADALARAALGVAAKPPVKAAKKRR